MESTATKVWFGQSKRATLFEGTCFNFLLLIFCVFFRNSFPKLCGKVTLISPLKKRIFCPKTTKFGPKLAFLVNLGLAYSVPCWWVGWWLWRAGCISQDTYLLYNRVAQHISSVTWSLKYLPHPCLANSNLQPFYALKHLCLDLAGLRSLI